jgi:hypothetical protein
LQTSLQSNPIDIELSVKLLAVDGMDAIDEAVCTSKTSDRSDAAGENDFCVCFFAPFFYHQKSFYH